MPDGHDSRPVWSAPGTRTPAEVAEVLAHRAARARAHLDALLGHPELRTCPICGHAGPFAPIKLKPGLWCPQCDSRSRHRLMRLWLDRHLTLPEGAEVVHFAAEPWARAWFEGRGARYRSADITDAFDLHLDITAMDLPDACLDLLIANHVLEHADDRAALAEIARVLRPGGRALLTVPLIEGWGETLEVPGLSRDQRALYYGDPEHLRFYGRDLRDRIRVAGLSLTEFAAVEPDVSAHGLARGERLFIAARDTDPQPTPREKGHRHG
jgi:SAM-dependent methyltransferase